MAFVAANSEKTVFETSVLEEGLEFPVDIIRQGFTVLGQLLHEGGVVCFDELVEQGLLGPIAFVGGAGRALPAL
jgi:hypothetical protein